MKKILSILFASLIFISLSAQGKQGLKVLISVDMEGITGVVNWEEVRRGEKDYDYFRKLMTEETNAAIEGAFNAGATYVLVRDAHGSARNILPHLLDERAMLMREWSGGPYKMVEGVDESFDAVLCVGYHAKNGTPSATLDHTMSSKNIRDVNINGISMPEIGINALLAGTFDVPIIFVAGDQAICDQSKQIFGHIETVAVKKGYGNAALNYHPEVSKKMIKNGVEKALKELSSYKSFKLKAPYKMTLELNSEQNTNANSSYPGVKRTGPWTLTFESNDLMETLQALFSSY